MIDLLYTSEEQDTENWLKILTNAAPTTSDVQDLFKYRMMDKSKAYPLIDQKLTSLKMLAGGDDNTHASTQLELLTTIENEVQSIDNDPSLLTTALPSYMSTEIEADDLSTEYLNNQLEEAKRNWFSSMLTDSQKLAVIQES